MKAKTLRTTAIVITIVLLPYGHAQALRAGPYRVTVKGADAGVDESPILVEISAPLAVGTYRLQPSGSAPAIPADVFDDHGKRFLAVILGRVPKGTELAYSLEQGNPSELPASQGLSISPRGRNLRVDFDGRLLTEYRVDVGNKPFYFPLIGPTGEPFTRAYPMATVAGEDRDHPHQRSCWLTHGKVNGVDFWSESREAGTIREIERSVIAQGPVLARLWTKNEWLAPSGKKVCTDERTVTFYRTTSSRILDFGFVIRADSGPVIFGETKEGMFGLRVASSMDVTRKTGGKITNSEGLTDESAWGQAASWVDYVGPVGGKTVGIAILNHPGSFRYPTNWHVRPYGLFAANPFGGLDFHQPERGEYTVAAGDSVRFGYRVILHEGATAQAGLPAQFVEYSNPPKLEVSAN
jgi:hypothetical protein